MHITKLKAKLFNTAAHNRVKRIKQKEPYTFHGFDIKNIYSTFNDLSFLDVGCGFGIDMSQAAVMGFKKIVGVDVKLYDDWLIAKKCFPSLIHITLESKVLPFEDKLFDFVNSSHVLEHVEDDIFLLQEMYRVLKDNGWAVIGVPNSENTLTIFNKVLGKKNPYLDPTHLREYTLSEITSKLQAVGFEVICSKKEGFVFPIPLLHRFYHFFTTCYFDFHLLNNLLANVIPKSSLGYSFLVKKSSKISDNL